MENTMKSAPIYRIFFRAALAEAVKRDADYRAEVDEWYANGDGASPEWVDAGSQPWFDWSEGCLDDPSRQVNIGGKGYRFPACPHGMSLWTDYDNICSGCEESLTPLQEARGIARERWLRFCDRWEWYHNAPGDLPEEARQGLVLWVMSLLPKP